MKIALVQVNNKSGSEKTEHPHAGLAYLGAYAINGGHEVFAIDAKYNRWSNSQLIASLLEIKPDIIGITVRTPDVKEAEKIAYSAKEKMPKVSIIVGGAHVTGAQERVLHECQYFDIGVVGEGEETLSELLNILDNRTENIGSVKGIIFRQNGEIFKSPTRPPIWNLDTLLFPAWDLFPRVKEVSLFTSRGCPYSCYFCQRVMGNKVRTMSVGRVIAEMKMDIEKYYSKFIVIEDEVFGLNKKWTYELLNRMLSEGIAARVRWMANSRVNIADGMVYKKMKEAGCVGLGFGIESGNQKILDSVQKGITLEQAKNAIKLAKKEGLQTHAFFILGHPGETKSTIRDTINFSCKLNPYGISFGLMIPYPGTRIYEMAKKGEGGYKGFHENWELYTKYFGKGLELEGLSTSTLKRYQKQAYLEFYLRNLRIFTLFKFVRSYLKKKR